MTRTARSAYPRAIAKDRSESRTGLDQSIRKNGAGGHNWGSLSDEHDLETSAVFDENIGEEEDVSAAPGIVEDQQFKSGPTGQQASQNLSDEDLEKARKFRKHALNKKDVDLSAIARTSAAASTSPPSSSGMSRFQQNDKQVPISDTTRMI